jgi:hypothetical protein
MNVRYRRNKKNSAHLDYAYLCVCGVTIARHVDNQSSTLNREVPFCRPNGTEALLGVGQGEVRNGTKTCFN